MRRIEQARRELHFGAMLTRLRPDRVHHIRVAAVTIRRVYPWHQRSADSTRKVATATPTVSEADLTEERKKLVGLEDKLRPCGAVMDFGDSFDPETSNFQVKFGGGGEI